MRLIVSFLSFFLMLSVLLISCSDKKTEASTPELTTTTKTDVTTLVDTISRTQFDSWTNRWSRKSRSYMDTSTINYFNMPVIDLTQLLGENPVGSRFYIGLDSLSTGYMPHIILVGTDSKGSPRLSPPYHMYDVTRACPPDCGPK